MKFIKQNWFNFLCALAIVYFSIVAIGANAQSKVNRLIVDCDGSKEPTKYTSYEAAKNDYETRQVTKTCTGVWLKSEIRRENLSSASSSRSSSKAPAISSSGSSSSLPKLVELQFVPSKIKDTEIIDSSVIEYRLYRGTIVDKIKPIGNPVKFVTTPPKDGEEWKLTAFNGIESDYVLVAR